MSVTARTYIYMIYTELYRLLLSVVLQTRRQRTVYCWATFRGVT